MKWYKVPGYLAEVTKYGDIRNSENEKRFNHRTDKDGYFILSVKDENGIWKHRRLHRLIALTFCKGYKEGLEVNHKDLNKQNNYYQNLEWVTDLENKMHAIKNGINVRENNGRAKLSNIDVLSIRSIYATGKFTNTEIAFYFNVSKVLIGLIVRNKVWKTL
jgi:hypothetical protein